MCGTPNSSRRISIFSAAHRVNDIRNSTRDSIEAQYNSARFSLRPLRLCEKLILALSESEFLAIHALQPRIRNSRRSLHQEVLHAIQHERGHIRRALRFDMVKFHVLHVFQPERWPQIFLEGADLYIVELDAFHVTRNESIR